jgi:hypothetical protein
VPEPIAQHHLSFPAHLFSERTKPIFLAFLYDLVANGRADFTCGSVACGYLFPILWYQRMVSGDDQQVLREAADD